MKQLIVKKEDLRHNINKVKTYIKEISNDNDYTIIAVVKGNGYGLGLQEYSEFLIENGIKYLAVATIDEAIALRGVQKEINILMLSPLYNKEELEKAVKNNITVTIDSKENIEAVNEFAQKGYNIKIHLKIDTGFGRYGFIYNDFENIIESIKSIDTRIEIEGIFSHFSDAYRKNNKHTIKQFERFKNVIEMLENNNINLKLKHICNSPAILNYPEMHLNAARIGSAFVGRVCSENNIGLKKIGELEVNIEEIKKVPKGFNISYLNTYTTKKETTLAIIPIGHSDGFNVAQNTDMFRTIDYMWRALKEIKKMFKKDKLTVVIQERRYNIIGTIRNVPYNCRNNRRKSKDRRYCYIGCKSIVYRQNNKKGV